MDVTRMFRKLTEQPLWMWAALAALVVMGVVLFVSGRRVKWNVRMLAVAALCIALSYVLSLVRLYRMPQGGSITPGSMLPVMAVGFAFGTLPGLVCGLAYGLLQLTQGISAVHPVSLLLDYPVAFMVLGLSGVARSARSVPEHLRLPMGVLLAGCARIVMHVLSGAVFFAEYAGDQNPWVYSLVYNLTSVGVDTLICVALSFIPSLNRALRSLGGRQLSSAQRA